MKITVCQMACVNYQTHLNWRDYTCLFKKKKKKKRKKKKTHEKKQQYKTKAKKKKKKKKNTTNNNNKTKYAIIETHFVYLSCIPV